MSFAGVSLIGDDSKASCSTWDTAADSSDSGYHLFVVRGYSRTTKDAPNGKCIDSRQFRVGGYRWHIEYYPNGCDDDETDDISFYLSLDDDPHAGEHATLQFEFSFVDQVDKQKASRIRATRGWNLECGYSWGYGCFVTRSIFELSSRHLKDDSFTVRCDIVITTNTANASSTERSSSALVSPPPSIQQHLISSLLLSGEGTDVAFEVGGETFMAHRCVLAARSPVFRAELFGPMKEGTTRSAIRIDDMEPKVFRLLLTFIYTDVVPDINDDDDEDDDAIIILWQHLLVAADIYDLQKLKLICEENLCEYIEATTVVSILALAEQHNCQGLKKTCLDFRNSLREKEILTRTLLLKLNPSK